MDIDAKYQETLELLKAEKRPFIKLNDEQLQQLAQLWNELNSRTAPEAEFFPVLCLADHLTRSHQALNSPLIFTLEHRKEENLLVYSLSASFKIIVEECIRQNERIPFAFLKALKNPLAHESWEVLEWSLRVIDQLGAQSLFLKNEVLARRPNLLQKLNPKTKNIAELINTLERRWGQRNHP